MSECHRCHRTDCAGTMFGSCRIAAEAYERGLRAGVDLARERAKADSWDARYLVWERIPIDWSDVDAELARRLG